MSQTNNNINKGQNGNQISGIGGRGQGPSSRGRGDCRNNCRNNSIANKYSFEGKMNNFLISKLKITKTRHRPSQYKKIIGTLSISLLYIDKNYQGLNDICLN